MLTNIKLDNFVKMLKQQITITEGTGCIMPGSVPERMKMPFTLFCAAPAGAHISRIKH